ncbi:MAG: hypothetical protein V4747_08575 [Pseudomonadota bacterium]
MYDVSGRLYPKFSKQIGEWVKAGTIQYREDMINGLERAAAALVGLLRGEAFGKRVVKLAA